MGEGPSDGIVIALQGRTATVQLARDGRAVRCELRGAVRAAEGASSRLAVGDHVTITLPEGSAGEGVVESVGPRRTRLARGRARREQVIAANVDQLVIVAAARDPDWRPGFVDRALCAAGKGELAPVVVASKVDLVEEGGDAALERDLAVYRRIGVPVIEASARTGAGVDLLREALRGRTSVVHGQSGVGKSTLLNLVAPGLGQATREVSRETGKGRHTTTAVKLIPLEGGGFVLDTPGVRSFGFYELEAAEVGPLFPEIAAAAARCRFRDCLHQAEPACAVRGAAAAGTGEVDPRRYASYLRILASLDGEDERD